MKQTAAFSVFLFLFFYACQDDTNPTAKGKAAEGQGFKGDNQAADSVSPSAINIKLDTFSKSPLDSGCSEYFAGDSLLYSANNFVFMSNLQGLSVIKVNGRLIFLKTPDSAKKDRDRNANTNIEVFQGDGYTIILRTTLIRNDGDESSIYSGTIEIQKDNIKTTVNVFGSGGC